MYNFQSLIKQMSQVVFLFMVVSPKLRRKTPNTNYELDKYESQENYHLSIRANIEIHNLANVDIDNDDNFADVPNVKLLSIAKDWMQGCKIRTLSYGAFDHGHEMNDIPINKPKFDDACNPKQVQHLST